MRRRGSGALPLAAPVPAHVLDRLRLRLRRRTPSMGLGVHRHRRLGQSLEFRDHRDYARGDDVRAVDWAASLRRGGRGQLVVKSFEAEERRTLILLVDCRPAMRLPERADKQTVGFWIAQCLIRAALAERDRVMLCTVFGPRDRHPLMIDGPRGERAALDLFQELRSTPPALAEWAAEPEVDTREITRLFRPASATVLISDMLFSDPDGRMAALAAEAQRSHRSLHVFELDSWPAERALLRAAPFVLGALAGRLFGAAPAEADDAFVARTDLALAAHRRALRSRFRGPGLVWPEDPIRWPAAADIAPDAFAEWFRESFSSAQVLPSLLSRAS